MNHFMLPVHPGSTSDRRSALEEASWGGYAMEALINEILKYGGRRGRLEIKVFGAARILAGMTDVGAKNILFVQAYLRDEGLKLVSADLGGVRPRRIRYSARTGRAGVQKLPALQSNEIIRQEHAHLEHILRRSSRSDIELF